MPTYQYSCTECGHFFEQFQSFHEDSLTVCPQCQGRLRKVFNAVGVVFKGSGFYRTDSRTDSRIDSSGDGAATKGSGDKAGAGSAEKSGSGGKSGSSEKSGSGDKAGSSSGSSGTPASSGSSTSAA